KERRGAGATIDPEDLEMSRHKVRLQVQERYLNDIAAIDEVRHVEEAPSRKLFNNVARPIMNAHVVVNSTAFEGDGQIVAVADTGFDKGSTTHAHPALTRRPGKLVPFGPPRHADHPDSHSPHAFGC